MRPRLLLGPVLIAALVGLMWLDERVDGVALPGFWSRLFGDRATPPPGTAIFVACVLVAVLAARELAAIMRSNGIPASRRVVTTTAVAGLAVSCLVPSFWPAPVAVAAVSTTAAIVLIGCLAFYSRDKSVEGAVAAAGGTLLAFVYLGLMFGFVLAIRRDHSAWVLLWFLLTTKSCDIGAYFTGKAVGRHKLIPWLSPGKTWEGLAGGVVLASGVGALGVVVLRDWSAASAPPPWTGAVGGAVFALVGQTGDLVMSLFKRDAGLKDSSRILPGFGGVLDVLDSPLLAAPAAYWWLHAVEGGAWLHAAG